MLFLLRRGTGDAYENVVQGRFGDGETGDARALHQGAQHLVRIAAERHAQLLHLAEIAHRLHAGQISQHGQSSLDGHANGVVGVLVLNGSQGAIQDLPAAEDHADVIAQDLGRSPSMANPPSTATRMVSLEYWS